MSQKPREKREEVPFPSGATVPVSGLWRPDHHDCVNAPDLWLPRQASFPPCPGCGLATQFVLLEEVPHISEDPDFQ